MRVLLTTHEFVTGPAQELLSYLNAQKKHDVLFIANRYLLKDDARTISTYYENGVKKSTKESWNFKFLPVLWVYLKDVVFTLIHALSYEGTWDIYIGGDGTMALPGIILKKLGKIKKLVFYTIDFSDNRFNSWFLRKLYIWVDKTAVYNADEVWNVSSRIKDARKKYYLLDKSDLSKQKVVPLGAWFDRIPKVPYETCLKHTVVFMGHLLEKQGVQLVIKAIPTIIKKVPDFKFRVLGGGPYMDTLKNLAKDLGVSENVEFFGYIEDHKKIESLISECALAVALYDPDLADFTYYADPGKVKNYLASGVPVLITDVPQVAKDIDKEGAGKIIEYSEKSISSIITNLLTKDSKIKNMRNKATKMGERFNWKLVFKEAGL